MSAIAERVESAISSLVPDIVEGIVPPPCFFWSVGGTNATMEKVGRSVCRSCADRLRGYEYPLRRPSDEPLYANFLGAAEALDMVEPAPRAAISGFSVVGA